MTTITGTCHGERSGQRGIKNLTKRQNTAEGLKNP
jgi:hypothetical protein